MALPDLAGWHCLILLLLLLLACLLYAAMGSTLAHMHHTLYYSLIRRADCCFLSAMWGAWQ